MPALRRPLCCVVESSWVSREGSPRKKTDPTTVDQFADGTALISRDFVQGGLQGILNNKPTQVDPAPAPEEKAAIRDATSGLQPRNAAHRSVRSAASPHGVSCDGTADSGRRIVHNPAGSAVQVQHQLGINLVRKVGDMIGGVPGPARSSRGFQHGRGESKFRSWTAPNLFAPWLPSAKPMTTSGREPLPVCCLERVGRNRHWAMPTATSSPAWPCTAMSQVTPDDILFR